MNQGAIGQGRGLSAARALMSGGAEVRAWDDDADRRAHAANADIPLSDLQTFDWRGTEALVLSPGVPLTHPKPHAVVGRAREVGAEVIEKVLGNQTRPWISYK